MKNENGCSGYISFVMLDDRIDRIIELGGAGFESNEEFEREWSDLPGTEADTVFLADKEDSQCEIIDDKKVTGETVSQKLGEPISVLIERGRRQLNEAEAKAHAFLNRRKTADSEITK